ncbi:MAG: hypothetical protein E7110_02960 [Bacteroidales bacterium]|nr:hypothetical protein [Bacteroidales bacterium]
MRKIIKENRNPDQLKEYSKYMMGLFKRGGITRKEIMQIMDLAYVSVSRKCSDQDFTLHEMIVIGNHIGKDFVYDFVDKDLTDKGYSELIKTNRKLNKVIEDQAATIMQLKKKIAQMESQQS